LDFAVYFGSESFMSSTRAILTGLLITFCFVPFLRSGGGDDIRLLFTGDILLSRQVGTEIVETHQLPWQKMKDLFRQADWVGGNLEGSVGDLTDCAPNQLPCFAIPPNFIDMLKQAGFCALSVENNHAGDLGEKGRRATSKELLRNGILPLRNEAPVFLRFGKTTVGLVAVSVVPGHDGYKTEVPSYEVSQRIRLARALSDLVIVSVHWGSELLNWPTTEQRQQAKWLVTQGADIVVGHHPHVIQALELVSGKPVYFSLGNHLFDQKYPETKEGLLADIRISGSVVRCGAIRTHTPRRSSFPEITNGEDKEFKECKLEMTAPLDINGYSLCPRPSNSENYGEIIIEGLRAGRVVWASRPARVVSLEAGHLGGPETPKMLLSLQVHNSPIDNEQGLRPYVYELGPSGLIAKWRGSALAWPLLDAFILPEQDSVICALHRGDSFITLNPSVKSRRIAAYRWNGFGFSGISDQKITERCQEIFEDRGLAKMGSAIQ
jgi:hypothetical protein